MSNYLEGLQNALDYIETHLDADIIVEAVAQKAYVSPFHFQRLFHALCGMPLGEYIRCRRLTLAGQELSRGKMKVIDAALKYGYDSPDSFARAFQRFHGTLPSQAREKGVRLNAFSPLHIKLTLEGGNMLEFKIVEKAAFTVMGSAATPPSTQLSQIKKFGTLHDHLARIEQDVQTRIDTLVRQMKAAEGITEELKVRDQMAWAVR